MILTLTLGIILLLLGFLMGGFVSEGFLTEMRKDVCRKSTLLKEEYWITVDKNVCSKDCPCPKGELDANEALWTSYGNDMLRDFNRTIPGEANLTYTEQDEWRLYGANAHITPLVFAGEEVDY